MFRGFCPAGRMNLGVSVSCSLQPLQLPPARARCICPGQNGMFLPPVTHSGQVPSITRAMYGGDGNIFSGQLTFFQKRGFKSS